MRIKIGQNGIKYSEIKVDQNGKEQNKIFVF